MLQPKNLTADFVNLEGYKMVLQRNNLNEVEPIKCPRKGCNGTLPIGLLTAECPVCKQIFMPAQLFPETYEELKRKQEKEDTFEA